MAIDNFNRIVNIKLINAAGAVVQEIRTPPHGRKPNIQIVALLTPGSNAAQFDIHVKNFYIDLPKDNYQRVRIEAGYYGATEEILDGSVAYIFQETPGPEGNTIIHCIDVNLENWLGNTVHLDLPEGFTLKQAMEQISAALGFNTPYIQPGLENLTSKIQWQYDNDAKNAIEELKKRFDGLFIRAASNKLSAYTVDGVSAGTSGVREHTITRISAPLQVNGSNETGAVAITLTAPWDPKIRPGDIINVFTKYYTTAGYGATTTGDLEKFLVNTIQIHFGTVGAINQMVIQGVRNG